MLIVRLKSYNDYMKYINKKRLSVESSKPSVIIVLSNISFKVIFKSGNTLLMYLSSSRELVNNCK